MAPSKAKPNAFYFFMSEKKPILEKKLGKKLNMSEVPDLLYSEWKEMSNAKKQKYVNMCNGARSSTEKLDSRGIPLRIIEESFLREEREEKSMKKHIISLIASLEKGSELTNFTIFIVSLQTYAQLADTNFIPAEIGLVQFNFKKGIISEFHKIMKADIPMGYKYEVTLSSESTHNLYEFRNHSSLEMLQIEGKYLFQEVKKFLSQHTLAQPTSEYILYTPSSQFEVVKNILEKDGIKIYSLDFLYMQMYNLAYLGHQLEIPFSIAEEALMHCRYDYDLNPACLFHRKFIEDRVKYCALSEVKRFCYNMCVNINIKKRFDIEPVLGRHLPGSSDANTSVSKPSIQQPIVGVKASDFITVTSKKSKNHNNEWKQTSEETEDSVSECMDNLSITTGGTETSASVAWPSAAKRSLPAGHNLLRGAWAAPSTVSTINTEDEGEFPLLGTPSLAFHSDDEGTVVTSQPRGVFTAPGCSSSGLQGFGRGKTFNNKQKN